MAKNLQSKLPSSDTLAVHDINPAAPKKFAEEVQSESGGKGAAVKIASSVKEASEGSVCTISSHEPLYLQLCDEFVFQQ